MPALLTALVLALVLSHRAVRMRSCGCCAIARIWETRMRDNNLSMDVHSLKYACTWVILGWRYGHTLF